MFVEIYTGISIWQGTFSDSLIFIDSIFTQVVSIISPLLLYKIKILKNYYKKNTRFLSMFHNFPMN